MSKTIAESSGAAAKVGDVVRCEVLGDEHVGRILEWSNDHEAFEVEASEAERSVVRSWLVSRDRIREILEAAE